MHQRRSPGRSDSDARATGDRHTGSAGRDHNHRWPIPSGSSTKISRTNRAKCSSVEAGLACPHRAPKGIGFATLAFNNMSGLGRSGTGVLKVDGKTVVTQTMQRSIPLIFAVDETFDIGSDTGSSIDDGDYQVPFNFTGTIDKLIIAVDRPKLTPADVEKLKQAEMSAQDAK